jgi:predicted dehydrogenase
MPEKLRIGVIGAGRWSANAHLPGWARSPHSEIVAICDVNKDLAEQRAQAFGIPHVYTDYREMLSREDIDVVDVCTRGGVGDKNNHEALAFAALAAGKHCLCEKPVAHDYRNTWKAHELAEAKGLKTKVGLTFRYAPAMQYMRALIADGFIGEPYIFNGYEQNSQFISPTEPLTKVDLVPATEEEAIKVSSIEGYGAPIIDLSMWFMDSALKSVVGYLYNFVPYRTMPTGERVRTNIDDGDVYIGEYERGGFCTIQSSYVTVNSYPGLEARAYGSEGALLCRLGAELDGQQLLLKSSSPNAHEVEYVPVEIPDAYYPPGYSEGEPWPSMFYANLVHNFNEEILGIQPGNQGNFAQSARVQEIINAVELSHRERRWVDLPLS